MKISANLAKLVDKKQAPPITQSQSLSAGTTSSKLAVILKAPLVTDTRIDILENGDQIFPSMLTAIEQATSEICFETYIYWSGEIAQQFADALTDAANRGVVVLIVLDWWGAHPMNRKLLDQMRAVGARICHFNPLHWWQLRRFQYRTHRKVLVVDRQVAFTGGVGIADKWLGDANGPSEWHDLHYRLCGNAVAPMHRAFCDMWTQQLDQAYQFPPQQDSQSDKPATDSVGESVVRTQVFTSSPRQGRQRIYQAFQFALENARESLLITTAYFVPDKKLFKLLVAAAKRGVQIQIMLPGSQTDRDIVRYASKSCWGPLLEQGVRIFEYQPSMLHAKYLVVDERWVSIGSANFDNRSFGLNEELNLNVVDERFAREHGDIFSRDRQRCRETTLAEWQNRSAWCRLKEWCSDLFRKQL